MLEWGIGKWFDQFDGLGRITVLECDKDVHGKCIIIIYLFGSLVYEPTFIGTEGMNVIYKGTATK